LRSNAFNKENIAETLELPPQQVIGTFFVAARNVIKITIYRTNISASMSEMCSLPGRRPRSYDDDPK
jgi:hypothetical protein